MQQLQLKENTKITLLIHCAGLKERIHFEKSIQYRQRIEYKKLNKNVRKIYDAIAQRFPENKQITGAIIRNIVISYCQNDDIFSFWNNIFKHTQNLNTHAHENVWLLPPKSNCQSCNQNLSLKDIRRTKIIDIAGILTAWEVIYACKHVNCTLLNKNVNYNGWIDAQNHENLWDASVTGLHRTQINARDLNKFVFFFISLFLDINHTRTCFK